MAINLVKGQTIDLRKNDKGVTFDLSKVTIGLGWDVRKKTGFLSGIFNRDVEYDLDAIAFLLDANGKVTKVFSEVYRKGDTWKFRAVGEPYQTDNFIEILKKYL